ncbi:MAG: hypothetical protein ACRDD8_11695 [Bacteroidales bacterium]
MKEYKAQTGGRYTYAEDLLNLQDLALSITSVFANTNNCVLSGCTITKLPSGNVNIASGFVWLDGKIRHFIGANDISIANGYYIKATFESESVKYANDASKVGREVYGTIGVATLPTDSQYIFINPDGAYPTIDVEFFGKYSVIKDPKASNQKINSSIEVVGSVKSSEITSSMSSVGENVNGFLRVLRTILAEGGVYQHYVVNADVKSTIQYGDDGKMYFFVDGVKVATFHKDRCEFIATSTTSQISDKIQIVGDNINLTGDSSTSGSIKFNFKGYNGGNSVNRSVEIFDGKGGKLFTFNGSGVNESYATLSINKSSNLILKHTDLSIAENGFSKFIEFQDRTGSSLAKVGFWGSQSFKVDTNGKPVECTSPSFSVSGSIFEGGQSLLSKYTTKVELEELNLITVKKDGNKVLTDVNFTQQLYDKLSGIKTSTVESNGNGYVVASDVKGELNKCLKLANDLSDLPNKSTARTNLSVYSKEESGSLYNAKANNLSDVSDVAASRTNLDVYSKEESAAKSTEIVGNLSYSKADSDGKYQLKLKIVDWTNCTPGGSIGQFNVRAKQYGNVVSIQGTLTAAGNNSIWLTIPNEIDPPTNRIGGVADMEIRDVSGNYGLKWVCDAGSRSIKVVQQHGEKKDIPILITYLI